MIGPAGHERRQGDRRHGERRRLPRFSVSEPWHNSIAGGDDPAWAGGDDVDSSRTATGQSSALPRLLRTYTGLRGALGLVLLLAPWFAVWLGGRPPLPVLVVCLAYAAQAISLWLLPGLAGDGDAGRDRLGRSQWWMTIGIDVAAFSLLRLFDESSQLNYAALLVLPVLMAGVLTGRRAALATAAVVTLVLLAGAMGASVDNGDVMLRLSQAGLASAGMFVIALLANELSQRLAREERAARGNMELARQQTQLSRVVIEEMTEGVLVVDRYGAVRAMNPAAQTLLGLQDAAQVPPFPLAIEPAWAPLRSAIERAFTQGLWPDDSREIELALAGDERRRVQVRARFTRRAGIVAGRGAVEDFCVLFLDDVRVVQARLRQDKLAAMGRMSAGIAHEIRNPLAAIAQANALLLEDGLGSPANERLARIVEDNVARLKRLVDDVMAVAPGAAPPAGAIDATAEVRKVCDEWQPAGSAVAAGADGEGEGDRLRLKLPSQPLPVLFDPEHLRRVLINLLDNAGRHASMTPGAIVLELQALPRVDAAELTLASDGPAIAPEVERYLFEPFFSTRARGSGLGLYICRELCERHRASIEFRPGAPDRRHRNCFRVLLPCAPPT